MPTSPIQTDPMRAVDLDEDSAATPLQAGVQSVEIAADILKALAAQGRPLPLKDVAKAAHMSRAKVHRYLVSLKRAGLVPQERRSGDYRIGPAAVCLGLVGLRSLSPVRAVNEAMPALRDQVEETVTMAIWGESGPVVVAMEESGKPVTINVRIGSVLPIATSAIGRVFAAFLPDYPASAELDEILVEVRMRRMARVRGSVMQGVDALASPIFDHTGKVVAVICTFGRAGAFDSRWSGHIAQILGQTASDLSRQFGFVEAPPSA